MNATIRDVARQAGVSVATVSRVINGNGPVSAATELKVRAVIDRLAYVPHGGARSLTTRRTRAIGVVLPETYGEFFSELIRGVELVARPAGYHLLVSGSHGDLGETEEVLRALHGRIDGLVLMMPGPGRERLFRSLPRRVPVVLLNGRGGGHDALRVDNRRGARLAVDHLLDLGHTRIALIGGPRRNADAAARRRGYREALRRRGVAADPALELEGDFREQSGFHAGTRLAVLRPRPTAVFAANDAMAIGCLAALHDAGLGVPADVSLVGFDDVPIARYVKPGLTTVRVPLTEVGNRAMRRLLERVETTDGGSRINEVVAPALSIRESTAPAPAAGRRSRTRAHDERRQS